MVLKRVVKNIIAKSLSRLDCPLVINSYGRSGSTVLSESIIDSAGFVDVLNLRSIVSSSLTQFEWNLEGANLADGVIYKSHDYPPTEFKNKKTKMLYTFSNPVNVVLSLLRLWEEWGEGWIKWHYEHLCADYTHRFEDIVHEDQLGLEKHLDAWLCETRIPIAFIRYETMWENQDKISDFLGFDIQLPAFRERKPKDVSAELVATISDSYEPFIKKINGLSDFFTNE